MRDRTGGWAGFFAALVALCACATDEFPTDDVAAPVCHTVVTTAEIATTNIDLTDVLFVIDDGASMVEEQATLRRELPRLVEMLVTGTLEQYEAPPIRDLHIGVISTDLGAVGVDEGGPNCTAWGDDALLQYDPNANGCAGDLPFLTYQTAPPLGPPPPPPSPDSFATRFRCLTTFGTDGCGYSQPLEASLKALWPSVDVDPDADLLGPNRMLFLGPSGTRDLGHGDRENAGFVRSYDPMAGISLLRIVVVTDKDDCSAFDSGLVLDPRSGQAPEARCAERQDSLNVLDRYVNGLQAVRPGYESLVTFSAITGVPPDLVSKDATSAIDLWYEPARDAYYDGILADPRMKNAQQPDGTLAPACENDHARATPARRLVEIARRFGENGMLLSICDDDWSPVLDGVTEIIAKQLGAVCLPRGLPRNAEGLTDCTVTWELPRPEEAPFGTPVSCDEVPSLLKLHTPHPISDRGKLVCEVRQLAVTRTSDAPVIEPGYGWYFDDFSDDVASDCAASSPQRIAFSEGAHLPTGVIARIECRDTRYLFPASGELAQAWQRPEVFDTCNLDAPAACDRQLQDADFRKIGIDHALYCHPVRRQCVPMCTAGVCPKGWRCNGENPAWCEPLECHVPG